MYFSSASLLFSLLATTANFVTAVPLEAIRDQPEAGIPHELEARAGKTVSYDCGPSGTPQICLNTCWAINCRHLPETLHGGKAISDSAHRKEWGYGQKSKWAQFKWGNGDCTSPEEYPYASTEEGGLDGAGPTLALRCVPVKEQQKQGGKLSGIGSLPASSTVVSDISTFKNLAYLRSLSHPVAGATYDWCDAYSSCVNDGHQFTATSKGVFTLG